MSGVSGLEEITLSLSLSHEELLRYYGGDAAVVAARSLDGRRVRFPARLLRPFVNYDGVHGLFRIWFTSEGRCHRMERVSLQRPSGC